MNQKLYLEQLDERLRKLEYEALLRRNSTYGKIGQSGYYRQCGRPARFQVNGWTPCCTNQEHHTGTHSSTSGTLHTSWTD